MEYINLLKSEEELFFEASNTDSRASTSVKMFGYNSQCSTAFVRFNNGSEYIYLEVPENDVTAVLNSDSLGLGVTRNIKQHAFVNVAELSVDELLALGGVTRVGQSTMKPNGYTVPKALQVLFG